MDIDKKIRKYVIGLYNLADEKFEDLLKDYLWEELHLTGEDIKLAGSVPVGFDVLYFPHCSKKQFVSTVTKKVLFEVEVIIPDDITLEEVGCSVCWTEYWRGE